MEIIVEKIVNLEICLLERLKLNVEIEVGHTSFKNFPTLNRNFLNQHELVTFLTSD